MDTYNPFETASTVLQYIISQAARAIRVTAEAVTTAGKAAFTYEVSTAQGRGATRLTLRGDEVAPLVRVLRSFDPRGGERTPAEVAFRTLAVSEDAVIFRVSEAKMARTISIPLTEWEGFLAHLEQVDGYIDRGVEHYRNLAASGEVK